MRLVQLSAHPPSPSPPGGASRGAGAELEAGLRAGGCPAGPAQGPKGRAAGKAELSQQRVCGAGAKILV